MDQQPFTAADGKLNCEYFVYHRLPNHQLDYLNATIAPNAREALKIVLAPLCRTNPENEEIDVNELDEGLWQM